MAQTHIDYWGLNLYLPWEDSMDYAVRKIIGAIHLKPEVIRSANLRLETGSSSDFVEMLSLKSVDGNEERTARWWGSETSTTKGNPNPVIGYSRTLHFEGARRIQSMDYFS